MDNPEKLITGGDCARIGGGSLAIYISQVDPVQIADLITKYGGALLVLYGVAQLCYKGYVWLFKKEKK